MTASSFQSRLWPYMLSDPPPIAKRAMLIFVITVGGMSEYTAKFGLEKAESNKIRPILKRSPQINKISRELHMKTRPCMLHISVSN